MTTTSPPRRNWHLTRWLLVLIIATLGWSGWRAYALRSALAEAKALGWTVEYTEPFETIRADWKAAFKKETWLDGVKEVIIWRRESFEQHFAIVHRLNPKALHIGEAATLRDLSALKPLTRLQWVTLYRFTGLTNVDGLKNFPALQQVSLDECTGLTNVDALKNLPALKVVRLKGCTGLTNLGALMNLFALEEVYLGDCTGLTNVDGLMNLPSLRNVDLTGCTGLTPETVAALKAALPNAKITGP